MILGKEKIHNQKGLYTVYYKDFDNEQWSVKVITDSGKKACDMVAKEPDCKEVLYAE